MAPSTQRLPLQILVVDDEPDLELLVRQKFRHQIRNEEYQFFFSPDGEKALETLSSQPNIDVVLSDINMPVMDGLTLLARINELRRTLRAVVVSAYGDMQNIRTAMNRGAIDFLIKPIDFDDLEVTIRKTVDHVRELRQSIKTQERLVSIERELGVAATIQRSIIPSAFPPFPDRTEFDLHAHMNPAKEVGGDFFDYFFLDQNRLGIVIGDVSGKGVPAALFMAISRTLLRATAFHRVSPGECLSYVNATLAAQNPSCMFVTLFYAILDLRTGELQYCNGGHNLPYVLSKEGTARVLDARGGLIVGVMAAAPYTTHTDRLTPGDTLVLFTDGVTEAIDPQEEFYGEERLEKFLSSRASSSVEQIVSEVHAEVHRFENGMPQADDITVLGLRYLQSGPDGKHLA